MRFSRKEYWSGLPCPPPGNLANSGIEPATPACPVLQADEFEQTQGESEGQGSLACCWGCRVRHDITTEQQEDHPSM